MKYKIGVMGKAGRSKTLPGKIIKTAEIIGREIAKNNCILVTGACMGVADIAAKAASKEKGLILGYSPAKNLQEHLEPPISYPSPSEKTELIFTGQGKIGRNVLSIVGSDGVIFIGGGIGTLNEFSIAYHEDKIIGVLEGVGDTINKILKFEEKLKEGTGKEFKAVVVKDKNPKRLVKKVIEEIKKRKEEPKKEIPITFRNERGKELMGVLHLPKKEKPPAVIISHGFQGTKTDLKIIKLARALREQGILAFRFDFEGCGDSEGNPKDITIEREVSDLNCALKAVLKECDIDSERIGFLGYSSGATVVSLFLKKFKIKAKSLVFWTPALDQKKLLKIWYDINDLKRLQEKEYLIKKTKIVGKNYYLENKNKDYSFLPSKLDLPVLIIHGKEDKDIPLEFSKRVFRLLKGRKKMIIIQGADHKFENYKTINKLINYSLMWFKKYLLKNDKKK